MLSFKLHSHLVSASRLERQSCILTLLFLLAASCGSKSSEPDPADIKAVYYTPAWSPDGQEIASVVWRTDDSGNASGYLSILDAATGEVRRERQLVSWSPYDLAWTPDGKWLLLGASPGIFKLSSALDVLVQLTSGQFHTSPSYSRARDLVFFTANHVENGGLHSITLDGDSLTRWSTTETLIYDARCFPDSSDSLIGIRPIQGETDLLVTFSPDSIGRAETVREAISFETSTVSYGRDFVAFIIEVEPPKRKLILLDRSTDVAHVLFSGVTRGGDFSPDGLHFLYPRLSGDVGLWIVDLSTMKQQQFTDGSKR